MLFTPTAVTRLYIGKRRWDRREDAAFRERRVHRVKDLSEAWGSNP
jgi:hypothetical protein